MKAYLAYSFGVNGDKFKFYDSKEEAEADKTFLFDALYVLTDEDLKRWIK